MDKAFEIATIKANEVIERLHYSDDGLVSTKQIVEIVSDILEQENPTEIECLFVSFSSAGVSDDYGAMMSVLQSDGNSKQQATIIVNSDKDAKFQRFSLIHELGHLITNCYTAVDEKNHYTISAHIKYNITSISAEECKNDEKLKNEQIANIFALKVLMPFNAFMKKVFVSDDLQSIADFFGVTKDAVRSRILLGD